AGCGKYLRGPQVKSRERTVKVNQALQAFVLRSRYGATCSRNVERSKHSPCNRLTMQQEFVRRSLFDRMANCVAKIQDHAQPGFALIPADNVGLHANGCSNYFFKRACVAANDGRGVLFHVAHQRAIADNTSLYALHKPGL